MRASIFQPNCHFMCDLFMQLEDGQCCREVVQSDKFRKMLFLIHCQFSKGMPKQLFLYKFLWDPAQPVQA